MRVEHFMTLNPVACEPQDSCAHAARLMRDRAVGCVVVLERGRVVGLVTDRMLSTQCLAAGLDPQGTRVADVMVADVACVSPDDDIFAVCDTMRSAHLARRLPVVGPRRQLLGLVSISDIAVVAERLVQAVLHEETHHSRKEARALTGAKRISKALRRPTKRHRLPPGPPIEAKLRPSREGLVRNVVPRQRTGRSGPSGQTGQQHERRPDSGRSERVGGGGRARQRRLEEGRRIGHEDRGERAAGWRRAEGVDGGGSGGRRPGGREGKRREERGPRHRSSSRHGGRGEHRRMRRSSGSPGRGGSRGDRGGHGPRERTRRSSGPEAVRSRGPPQRAVESFNR